MIGSATRDCQPFRDRDEIHAGRGNDTISVVDEGADDRSFNDTVYCGAGEDTVFANDHDKLYGCENVHRQSTLQFSD